MTRPMMKVAIHTLSFYSLELTGPLGQTLGKTPPFRAGWLVWEAMSKDMYKGDGISPPPAHTGGRSLARGPPARVTCGQPQSGF